MSTQSASYKDGKWARQLLLLQHEDGSWGEGFHGLSRPDPKLPPTTEQALRRLHALGFTRKDPAVADTLTLLEACLQGKRRIDDYWEKGHDWDLYTQMMLSAWIRIFDPDNETALIFANRLAKVISCAFASGSYDEKAYRQAYALEFSPLMKGDREGDFVHFYCVNLLPGLLEKEIEEAFVDYVLDHETGIYYLNRAKPMRLLPESFPGLETTRYLAGLQGLAGYPCAKEKLAFAADWILSHRQADGKWDLGSQAKDGIYLPLSDSWRRTEDRRADCSHWIRTILSKLEA